MGKRQGEPQSCAGLRRVQGRRGLKSDWLGWDPWEPLQKSEQESVEDTEFESTESRALPVFVLKARLALTRGQSQPRKGSWGPAPAETLQQTRDRCCSGSKILNPHCLDSMPGPATC